MSEQNGEAGTAAAVTDSDPIRAAARQWLNSPRWLRLSPDERITVARLAYGVPDDSEVGPLIENRIVNPPLRTVEIRVVSERGAVEQAEAALAGESDSDVQSAEDSSEESDAPRNLDSGPAEKRKGRTELFEKSAGAQRKASQPRRVEAKAKRERLDREPRPSAAASAQTDLFGV